MQQLLIVWCRHFDENVTNFQTEKMIYHKQKIIIKKINRAFEKIEKFEI